MSKSKKKKPEAPCKLTQRFAAALVRERAKQELTQANVAERTQLSVSYISMLERAQRDPALETVERVAGALGLDPVKLFA